MWDVKNLRALDVEEGELRKVKGVRKGGGGKKGKLK